MNKKKNASMWANIIDGAVLVAIVGGMTAWMFELASQRADIGPGGLPPCTNAIADSGGMCQGPLAEDI